MSGSRDESQRGSEAGGKKGLETYLDVQEVTDLEADSRAVDRRIVVDGSVIAHVGPHCKRYRFRLDNSEKPSINDSRNSRRL